MNKPPVTADIILAPDQVNRIISEYIQRNLPDADIIDIRWVYDTVEEVFEGYQITIRLSSDGTASAE